MAVHSTRYALRKKINTQTLVVIGIFSGEMNKLLSLCLDVG